MQDRSIREPPHPATFEPKPITKFRRLRQFGTGVLGGWDLGRTGDEGRGGVPWDLSSLGGGALIPASQPEALPSSARSVVFNHGVLEALAEVGEGDSALRMHLELFRESAERAK